MDKGLATGLASAKGERNRAYALTLWVLAIALEVIAVFWPAQMHPPNLALLLMLLFADGALAITAAMLWRIAEQGGQSTSAFQRQLASCLAVIAFFPLAVLVFMDKKSSRQAKAVIVLVAMIALLAGAYLSFGLERQLPESVSQQSETVIRLMGVDEVFWTASGTKLHLYKDCFYINTTRTKEVFSGSVADAYKSRKLEQICKPCQTRAESERPEAALGDASEPLGSD